jgi:predicted AAA+ superfamily ATPase
MSSNDKYDRLIDRLDGLLDRVENLAPARTREPDWSSAYAFRWRKARGGGYIQAVMNPHQIRLDDLQDIDRQRAELERNTQQFLKKLPAFVSMICRTSIASARNSSVTPSNF